MFRAMTQSGRFMAMVKAWVLQNSKCGSCIWWYRNSLGIPWEKADWQIFQREGCGFCCGARGALSAIHFVTSQEAWLMLCFARSLLRILQCCKFRRLEIGICIWTCIYCDYTLTVSHTVVIHTLPNVSMITRVCLFLTFCRNPTQGCAWPPCFPCLPRGVACAPESFSFWLVSCAYYEDICSVEISLTDFWWFFSFFPVKAAYLTALLARVEWKCRKVSDWQCVHPGRAWR